MFSQRQNVHFEISGYSRVNCSYKDVVRHTTFHSFSYGTEEGDRSVILGKRLVFLFVNWGNFSFFPRGWEVTLAQWSVKNNGERLERVDAPSFRRRRLIYTFASQHAEYTFQQTTPRCAPLPPNPSLHASHPKQGPTHSTDRLSRRRSAWGAESFLRDNKNIACSLNAETSPASILHKSAAGH